MARQRYFVQAETACERCDGAGSFRDPTGLWAQIDAVPGLRRDPAALDKWLKDRRDAGSFTLASPPPIEEPCAACGGRGWTLGERVNLVNALRALNVRVEED